MTRTTILTVVWMLAAGVHGVAAEVVAFDSDRWEISAAESEMTTFLDRECLMLKGGIASLADAMFLDGVLEFDLAFTGERGFMGAVWRMQDAGNYENFYVRPHQSGFPDANQYTPVFNHVSGWQLYHGEGYGAPIVYDTDRWHTVKIVVSGQRAEVYIDDMTTPLVSVPELKREAAPGRVGLMAGNFAPAYFSNFQFTPADAPALSGSPAEPRPTADGTVMSWMVSEPFDEAELEGTGDINATVESLQWTALSCEQTGLANLARVCVFGKGQNTTVARIVVTSDRAQRVLLELGYSDRARVYLGGRLLYAGNNTYRSRDFRYLGTIGLFDAVPLDLEPGPNELWIAVSESFGGWGVMARFPSKDGIRIESPDGR